MTNNTKNPYIGKSRKELEELREAFKMNLESLKDLFKSEIKEKIPDYLKNWDFLLSHSAYSFTFKMPKPFHQKNLSINVYIKIDFDEQKTDLTILNAFNMLRDIPLSNNEEKSIIDEYLITLSKILNDREFQTEMETILFSFHTHFKKILNQIFLINQAIYEL